MTVLEGIIIIAVGFTLKDLLSGALGGFLKGMALRSQAKKMQEFYEAQGLHLVEEEPESVTTPRVDPYL